MLPSPLRYIVIEGPIGVGKTTLARRLACRMAGRTLLEDPAENPFLRGFYRDPARYALPAQLSFLLARANQLRDLAQSDLFAGVTLADFMLEKDPLFAELNLAPDELRLYQAVYLHLQPVAPTPDLVVYLQAPPPTLLRRIHRRGRDYERDMDMDYLARLARRYAQFFRDYRAAPVLVVDTERYDFADREGDLELLLARLASLDASRSHL